MGLLRPPSSTSGGQNLTRKSQEITNGVPEINQEDSRDLQQHHKCKLQATQEINRQAPHKWGQEKCNKGLSTAKLRRIWGQEDTQRAQPAKLQDKVWGQGTGKDLAITSMKPGSMKLVGAEIDATPIDKKNLRVDGPQLRKM